MLNLHLSKRFFLKLFITGAFLAPFLSLQAQVFDPTLSVATSPQTVCKYYPPSGIGDTVPASVWNSYVQSEAENRFPNKAGNRNGRFIRNYYGNGCDRSFYYSLIAFDLDENGDETAIVDSSFSALPPTAFENSQACEQQENPMSYSYKYNDRCYQAQILKERDSCEDGDLYHASELQIDQNYCGSKTDGSICQVENVINVLWSPVPKSENTCYDTNNSLVKENLNITPTPDSGLCVAQPDGMLMCEGTAPSTDNGFTSNRYCGTVNDSDVCYDTDNDSDIIPDSQDPDIDGDNEPNITDPKPYDPNIDSNNCGNDCEIPDGSGGGSGGGGGGVLPDPTVTDGDTDAERNILMGRVIDAVNKGTFETQNNGAALGDILQENKNLNTTMKDARNGIGALNDGIGNIAEILQNGENTVFGGEPSEGLQGFYESEYENGFATIWEEKQTLLYATPVFSWVQSWNLTTTGVYAFPEVCFNVIQNFGCHSFQIDPRVFPFIRIILIFTSLMFARKLITGG